MGRDKIMKGEMRGNIEAKIKEMIPEYDFEENMIEIK